MKAGPTGGPQVGPVPGHEPGPVPGQEFCHSAFRLKQEIRSTVMRALYEWTMDLAAHRHARWGLAVVSFVESSVFPIPPDVVLIPMIIAKRAAAWTLAAICTLSSVLGGIAGYAIGYFLFDTIGLAILDFYGKAEQFSSFQAQYNDYGVWIVLIAGLTPFPYKVITIASGVTGLNFLVFVLASLVARGLRFYAVAALLWYFGEPIRGFIDKYFGPLTIIFVILLIGGFVLLRYI